MRIAMVTPRYKNDVRGGGEISCQLLVKTLRILGVEVDVFSGDILFPDEQNTWKLNIKMYRLLKSITNEYDIWHTYNMSLLPAVGLLSKKYNINSIGTLNGSVLSPTLSISRRERLENIFFLQSLLRHIKKFTTLSHWYKEMWEKDGIPQGKIRVIPNMIPKDFAIENLIPQSKILSILTVGNYARIRNIKMLLDAYSKLPKQKIALKIVGQGWEKEIKAYNGENILQYYPYIEHEDLKEIFVLADIYVQSYNCSAIGRTFLEAAQSKTAIVTTGRKQDFPYLHKYLNYFKDAKMLQKTLQTLIEHKEIAKEQGKQLSKIVKKNYNPEVITKKYIKIYQKTI